MAEAINEGKSLLEQDGGEQAAGEEVSQDEKDAVVAEAMSEEDFGEDEE
jgi:30S ribosomal protein S2